MKVPRKVCTHLLNVQRRFDTGHIVVDISLQRIRIDRLPHNACHGLESYVVWFYKERSVVVIRVETLICLYSIEEHPSPGVKMWGNASAPLESLPTCVLSGTHERTIALSALRLQAASP